MIGARSVTQNLKYLLIRMTNIFYRLLFVYIIILLEDSSVLLSLVANNIRTNTGDERMQQVGGQIVCMVAMYARYYEHGARRRR